MVTWWLYNIERWRSQLVTRTCILFCKHFFLTHSLIPPASIVLCSNYESSTPTPHTLLRLHENFILFEFTHNQEKAISMLEKLLTTTPTAAKLWLLYIRYIFQFMHTCVTEFQEAGQRRFNKVRLVGANEHRYLVKCFAKSTIINMWMQCLWSLHFLCFLVCSTHNCARLLIYNVLSLSQYSNITVEQTVLQNHNFYCCISNRGAYPYCSIVAQRGRSWCHVPSSHFLFRAG